MKIKRLKPDKTLKGLHTSKKYASASSVLIPVAALEEMLVNECSEPLAHEIQVQQCVGEIGPRDWRVLSMLFVVPEIRLVFE